MFTPLPSLERASLRPLWRTAAFLLVGLLNGCAAITNPVADGVPVRRLPPELFGPSRDAERQLPLNLLRQQPVKTYRLEAGDVLGIYIEGVLGDRTQQPPVRLVEQSGLPPAMGYPIPVREDGTISLPLVEPIRVQGMSIAEAEQAVRYAYTVKKEILKPGRERIIVTLLQPRTYSILVVRQDQGGQTGQVPITFGGFTGTSEVLGPRKRGTGYNLELPAYENDVLNALTRSGGLPGLDARNEVIIYRTPEGGAGRDSTAVPLPPQQCLPFDGLPGMDNMRVLRIPLRLPSGTPIPFQPEDIVLRTGDIVFVPSRDAEVFYTGGLLISGQYPLPRDYDLDVVSAISLVKGTLVNGGQNSNNFTGTTQNVGIGFPNPSLVSVIRRTPGGGQVNIRVNLNRALQDPRERLRIQPNDVIILQSTMGEALAQYFSTTFFKYDMVGTVVRQRDLIATTTINTP
jgi:protein involved in polysaccharide export with SLBB domain